MAKRTKKEDTAEVIASTTDVETVEAKSGADVVYISCGLRNGHKFDDVGSNNNEVVILPGIDDSLRGNKGGILTPDGNAVLISLPRKQWEDILAKHGQERMFKGSSSHAPLVFEVNSKEEFKARQDEIKTSITGIAPKDLSKMGVTVV